MNDFYPPLDINPYERCRRPSRRQRDGLIVGKVCAGVPTRRAPRISPTIERSQREPGSPITHKRPDIERGPAEPSGWAGLECKACWMVFETKDVAAAIDAPAEAVYAYASNPANLSAWAAGLAGTDGECDHGR